MPIEVIDTLVVGAGQAGIAMSEHLGKYGIPHFVLERHRIAERWRSERWDSLVANGPAWHDRFPGMEFPGAHPDDFVPKEKVADYFVAYADMIAAPIRCGVEVRKVRQADRPSRLPRRDLARAYRGEMRGRGDGRLSSSGHSRPGAARCRRSRRSTRTNTAIPRSCRTVRCWSSVRALQADRSPTSCSARAGGSLSPSVRTRVRREPIAGATIAGGWACWANGMCRRPRRAPSTSPSP